MQETKRNESKTWFRVACTTSSLNMEQIYSYNPGAQHGAFTKLLLTVIINAQFTSHSVYDMPIAH